MRRIIRRKEKKKEEDSLAETAQVISGTNPTIDQIDVVYAELLGRFRFGRARYRNLGRELDRVGR